MIDKIRETKVEIRPKTIIFAIFLVGGLIAAIHLKNVVITILLAFVINAGLRPIIRRLEDRKIPRNLAVTIIYVALFIFLFFLLALTIDVFLKQLEILINELPNIVRNILQFLNERIPATKDLINNEEILASLEKTLRGSDAIKNLDLGQIFNLGLNAFGFIGIQGISIVSNVLGGFFTLFTIVILSIYMLNRKENLYEVLSPILPTKIQPESKHVLIKIEKSVGNWFAGQMILMWIIGIMTYIAIMLPYWLGIDGYQLYKFALLLSILAGFFEGLPNVGPTITAFICALFGIGTGSSFAVIAYIVVACGVIQQLEGIFIVPQVMKKVVDIDPILSIIAIIAGLQIAGVYGAILSIPVVVSLRIILEELRNKGLY